MNFENSIVFIGIALVIYIIINISYSKEIYYFVPKLAQKILCYCVLWLVPFVGALYVHHHKYLKPMRNYKEGSPDEGNAISSSFLEVDSILNPGSRNQIEHVQKQKISQNQQQRKFDDKDKNSKTS